MTLTLEHVWAQCTIAELHPTAIAESVGLFSALCPVCTGEMHVKLDGEDVVVGCSNECNSSRIADELHFRTSRNDTSAWSSWAPASLVDALAGVDDDPPSILARSDGHALFYAGRLHNVFGEPESGKGWLMVAACAQQLTAGRAVVYVDFEDTAGSIVRRLLAVGVAREQIAARFSYIRPEEPLSPDHWRGLQAHTTAASLVVLDGVTEALALQGLDLQSNSDIATWFELLPRKVARLGPAVVMVDHVVKDKEARGRYSIGAQHKLAGVDVAYHVAVIEAFGRGREGRLKISVTKDRPGHVRGFADDGIVAIARLTSHEDGAVAVVLEAPDERTESFRPTVLMERVSRAVEDAPGLPKRELRSAVKGKHEMKDLALELLVSEGYIEPRRDGQAVRHHSLRPFREDDETPDRAPVPQPCPDRAPAHAESTVPPCPLPTKGHGERGTPDAITNPPTVPPRPDDLPGRWGGPTKAEATR